MPHSVHRPRLLAALLLTLPLLAAAQDAPAGVPERALRDAERVFSIIKFHAVRPRTADKPRRPPIVANTRPAGNGAPAALPPTAGPVAQSLQLDAPLPAPEPVPAAALAVASADLPALADAALPSAALPLQAPAASAAAANEPPDDEGPEDAGLQLRHYVEPALPPAVQATLGAGLSRVSVRFTVAADGRVTQAAAAAGTPRRLARPATEAVLQWQFEPLPQPRTADVEIAFRRE